jgi:hypothetical protein
MSRQNATLTVVARALAKTLQLAIALHPTTAAQQVAQRDRHLARERARRLTAMYLQPSSSGSRRLRLPCSPWWDRARPQRQAPQPALAMLIFAAAAVVTMVVVASEGRPFNGPFRVGPEVLRQVLLPPGA